MPRLKPYKYKPYHPYPKDYGHEEPDSCHCAGCGTRFCLGAENGGWPDKPDAYVCPECGFDNLEDEG